jgi:hypothetical protein
LLIGYARFPQNSYGGGNYRKPKKRQTIALPPQHLHHDCMDPLTLDDVSKHFDMLEVENVPAVVD